jgi:copper oxidase (laccase) domain-containing protein
VVAIHAGWRGIAAGIIGSTVDALGDSQAYQAIIGPAIGPCCYEVDGDVADAVEAALPSPRAIDRRSRSKPHLDLQLAVVEQLSRHGAKTTEWVRTCTRCSKDLWSYRRDGPGKGRNLAFVWLDGEPLA